MTPNPPPAPQAIRLAADRKRAILMVLGAAGTFTLAAACVKALDGDIPLPQLVLFRNFFALPILLLLVMRSGGLGALRPRVSARFHLERIFWGLGGMFGAFYGYTHLPLATVTALGFTMPLFLTALAVVLLKERVGWRRWTAVAVGFAGVLVILRPFEAGQSLHMGAVLAVLFGAVAWALAMMAIRRLGNAGESGVAIVFWFATGSAIIAGLIAIPVWVWPDPRQWALLIAIGVISAFAQLMMTAAYRAGETTLLAPFEYSGLLWTTLLGIAIWSEWPDAFDLVGFAVLVGAGLFIWWRETRLGVKR
jgi:drug/metabolite transporter (DMT)-like permease